MGDKLTHSCKHDALTLIASVTNNPFSRMSALARPCPTCEFTSFSIAATARDRFELAKVVFAPLTAKIAYIREWSFWHPKLIKTPDEHSLENVEEQISTNLKFLEQRAERAADLLNEREYYLYHYQLVISDVEKSNVEALLVGQDVNGLDAIPPGVKAKIANLGSYWMDMYDVATEELFWIGQYQDKTSKAPALVETMRVNSSIDWCWWVVRCGPLMGEIRGKRDDSKLEILEDVGRDRSFLYDSDVEYEL